MAEQERKSRGARNDEPVGFDVLGRGPQLLATLSLMVRFDAPLVVGVYGDWGQGKTSFMRSLQSLLAKKDREQYATYEEDMKVPEAARVSGKAGELVASISPETNELLSVWFNPWQHQFEDEPIFPLLDAIRNQQASHWTKLNEKFRQIVEDPKFRIIGKAALGVSQLVGPGWLNVLTRQIGDEAREVMKQFGSFRDEFNACMEQLTKTTGGRLVIFIDDLDRCEAEYTVRILEALKLHLLNPHCVFVLGCADVRVRAALKKKKIAETEEEARDYLEKIVQVPVRLPRPRDNDIGQLLRRLGWDEFVDDTEAFDLFKAFAGKHANPRRIKRFLHWYEMERSMVDFVPGLEDHRGVAKVLKHRVDFLKLKMLQFLDPDGFMEVDDFRKRDTGEKARDAVMAHDPEEVDG